MYSNRASASVPAISSFRASSSTSTTSSYTASSSVSTINSNVQTGFVSAGSMINTGRRTLPAMTYAPPPKEPSAPRRKESADPKSLTVYKALQQIRKNVMSTYKIKNATSVLSDTSLKQLVSL